MKARCHRGPSSLKVLVDTSSLNAFMRTGSVVRSRNVSSYHVCHSRSLRSNSAAVGVSAVNESGSWVDMMRRTFEQRVCLPTLRVFVVAVSNNKGNACDFGAPVPAAVALIRHGDEAVLSYTDYACAKPDHRDSTKIVGIVFELGLQVRVHCIVFESFKCNLFELGEVLSGQGTNVHLGVDSLVSLVASRVGRYIY
jgi:hypothetical protein